MGAIAVHVAAFLVFGQMHPLPKSPYIPPPNFGVKTTTYVDPQTGEKTIEREIRVSTRLAPRGTWESRPKAETEPLKKTDEPFP